MKHVAWVWMENHTAESVFGAPDVPVETTLKDQCGSSSAYQSVGSPSLPNYVGATSGDTGGIADDAPPTDHPLTSDNLFRQTRAPASSATVTKKARLHHANWTAPAGRSETQSRGLLRR